jgi:DNA-binding MarR family transcriptional regulator
MNATAHREGDTGRAEHIRELAACLQGVAEATAADGVLNAIAHAVADAVVTGDGTAMEAAASELRVAAGAWEDEGGEGLVEERGRLYGFVDILRWVLQDRSAEAAASGVEPGTHAHKMLSLLVDEDGDVGEALNGGTIAARLHVDKTQVSRTGRELIERGLVFTSSLGRMTFWEITPRGQYALERLGAAAPTARPTAPLALALGDITDARAEEIANGLTGRHRDVVAYVVGRRAGEIEGPAAARKSGPVMLIDSSRSADRAETLAEEVAAALPKPARRLAIMAESDDARVRTVLPKTAAAARLRRAGRTPTPAA